MAELTSSQASSIERTLEKTRDLSSSKHELQLERQAIRILDFTVIPVITLFYLFAFLDRSNIGNARVAGLQSDLHLTDKQYQICITVLYVPYIVAELPSNLLLRKIGPRLLLPMLLTLWGLTATLQGFVTSFGGLVTVRAFLGLIEGPLTPAIVLYLSSFYTRKELSLRHAIALFQSAASLAGAFSGLLAAAIEKMDGIGGRPGWAWIFILEGLISVLVGLLGFFIVPSTPRECKFLTEFQKELIMRRLEKDRPSIKMVDSFSLKEVVRSVTSPHVIIVMIIAFMGGTMIYGLALFLPSIINELGFSPSKSQLLSVGPFAAGFFGDYFDNGDISRGLFVPLVMLIAAYWSDRHESRGIVMAIVSVLAVAGFALYLTTEHKFMTYGSLYLTVPGVFGAAPILSAWVSNNSEPYYRRATSLALCFIMYNAGGILSIWSFTTKQGSKFRGTAIMNLIFSVLVIVGCFANIAYLSWRKKLKKLPGVRGKLLEKHGESSKEGDDGGLSAWMELGDQHPDFVYTL
ncbi:MFS general substrate transporter [Phlegmacium glaucopus]|nr:MFS general substrate transporter [Phlegmacium glaucopus]